ncbi:hypothetical protein DE146DRAFT_635682 [Phaeosphaeria sp. MPI-PUGE-AT-0046c]|nr:hypothetical protein DE146DRAFT_635682 [Phaeosphaeria sp. MPI-PUGE-AT-0046c]
MSPTPIIVIGRIPKILDKVREDLLPEYDAIHMLNDVDRSIKDLPLLLTETPKKPEDSATNAGSQNYSARPLAVAVGGYFDDAMFNQMKDTCKAVDKGIVWLRPDTTKFKSMPSLSDTDAFGIAMAERVKTKLIELGVGKETGTEEGVHFF